MAAEVTEVIEGAGATGTTPNSSRRKRTFVDKKGDIWLEVHANRKSLLRWEKRKNEYFTAVEIALWEDDEEDLVCFDVDQHEACAPLEVVRAMLARWDGMRPKDGDTT
jgi:hypothetical protein